MSPPKERLARFRAEIAEREAERLHRRGELAEGELDVDLADLSSGMIDLVRAGLRRRGWRFRRFGKSPARFRMHLPQPALEGLEK